MRQPRIRAVLVTFETIALAAVPASGQSIRVEGNFFVQGEIRRDADAEFDDRRDILFGQPLPQITGKRPGGDWEGAGDGRGLELRLFAYPVPAIEIFAKMFGTNDLFLDEAHTRFRTEREGSGLETYFHYRQGRLSLGDPILAIAFDDAREARDGNRGFGVATNWWLRRGVGTFSAGRWSGEVNLQNTSDRNFANEDNEAYAAKVRHDVRLRDDLQIAGEALYARKNFTDTSALRSYNQIAGAAVTVSRGTSNLAAQWHISEAQNLNFGTPDNDAFGLDIRNATILDRPWAGRVGFNGNIVHFGRNYRNFVGRQPDFVTIGDSVGGLASSVRGDRAARTMFGEVFWIVPKVQANITLRYERRQGDVYQDLFDRREVDVNVGLVKGIDVRTLFRSELLGDFPFLRDIDAPRTIRSPSRRTRDLTLDATLRRRWGHVRLDGRWRRPNGRATQWIGAAEFVYKFTPRIQILLRHMRMWTDAPQNLWGVVDRPGDIGGGRASVVEPFRRRHSTFAQLLVRPTDNSNLFLEYGQGFHGDNDLALDGDFLLPGRRTDDRIFTKLEMWF